MVFVLELYFLETNQTHFQLIQFLASIFVSQNLLEEILFLNNHDIVDLDIKSSFHWSVIFK